METLVAKIVRSGINADSDERSGERNPYTSSSMTVEKKRRLRAPVSASVNEASRSSRLAEASSALRAATASSRRVRSASRWRVRHRTTANTTAAAATTQISRAHHVCHQAGCTSSESTAGSGETFPAAETQRTSKR